MTRHRKRPGPDDPAKPSTQRYREQGLRVTPIGAPSAPPPLELDPSLPAWDQQPGESPRHYAYFRLYLETPPQRRSLQLVADLTGISHNRIGHISGPHKWVARVAAWDAEDRRRWHAELEAKRRELITQHLRVSQSLLAVVLKALEQPAEVAKNISLRDVPVYATAGAEMARKALGMDAGQGSLTAVSVAATQAGETEEGRAATVEVRVMHAQILGELDELAGRLTPEEWAAAQAELAERVSVAIEGSGDTDE